MSSIALPNGFLNGRAWRSPFEHESSRYDARIALSDAARRALGRALFQGAAPAGTPATPVAGQPTGTPSATVRPQGISATLVTRTEDASWTIKTAGGDTVTHRIPPSRPPPRRGRSGPGPPNRRSPQSPEASRHP